MPPRRPKTIAAYGCSPSEETIPGLLMVSIKGRMTFAGASQANERLWAQVDEAHPDLAILACSAIHDVEYPPLQASTEKEEKLRERRSGLWLAALSLESLKVVERSPLGQALETEHMFLQPRRSEDLRKRGIVE